MDLKEFFLVTLPGLEDLALKEALEWFPEASAKTEHGGVTLNLPLEQGLSMNMALKIPTRILLRVTRFKCRDFPKLFQRVSSFPWRDWVLPESSVEVHVATSRSRLNIKKRIKETCEKAWVKAVGSEGSPLGLYVRIQSDICTLSLDTSGVRLHKRGREKHIGHAPLRETIGAAMLQMLGRHTDSETKVEVIDPMVGSGTLLMEALLRDEVISSREFSFQTFRSPKTLTPTLRSKRPQVVSLIGVESDKKTALAARFNFEKLGIPPKRLSIHNKDLFGIEPLPKQKSVVRWVLCNPPYGKRIKVTEPLKDFYEKLLKAIDDFAHPDLTCILIPQRGVKGKLSLPPGWKVLEKIKFSNGGITVTAYVFKARHQNS